MLKIMTVDKILLFPYYAVLYLRNKFYDKGWLKTWVPTLPCVCVGNITVGGTGKTPMVEALIRIFSPELRIAVVSRGYGRRRSKEQRFVRVDDDYRDVGDEPLQIKKKFPEVIVLVDGSRRRAVEALAALPEEERPELVILDDAFQHRAVRPQCSLLLVSSRRPLHKDRLLPLGRLRDLPSQVRRADMIVVTKLEDEPDADEKQAWRKSLGASEEQKVAFATVAYAEPEAVFEEDADPRYKYAASAILLSGIADEGPFKSEVAYRYKLVQSRDFPDHHSFKPKDIREIEKLIAQSPTSIIVTTEKDARRLEAYGGLMSKGLRSRLFYLPIEARIFPETDCSSLSEMEAVAQGYTELRSAVEEVLKKKV